MDETRFLGARERQRDERDLVLGAGGPVAITPTYLVDYSSWFVRNYQGKTAFCGEHAGAHFKAILDFVASNGAVRGRKSPRYGAIKLKDPHSPVYDGFPVNAGTDMRAIFKWLQKVGAADYEPLENDVFLPSAQYASESAVTPSMDSNAAQSQIANYAFGSTDFQSLCQLIYQNKAVLLLIKCDDGFWGTATPTFTKTQYGHFIVAYGYDENGIYVVDSADPNDAYAFKYIHKQYITPEFFFESGTAIDPVQAQAIKSQIVTDSAEVVKDVSEEQAPAPQKTTILEEIEQAVESIL